MEVTSEAMKNFEADAYKRAHRKVRRIRGFYVSLTGWAISIPVLVCLNLAWGPQFHWFYFPILGWGTAVLVQGVTAFSYVPFLNKSWEERKLRKLMNKDKDNQTTTK